MKIFNQKQYQILSERYFECLLGDFSSLIVMIGQSPLIALLVIFRWKSWQATESLYFIMALSSLWFGCINSCREIAKEKQVFLRERLFGVNVVSYYLSKLKVLLLIGLIEIVIFLFMLNNSIDLNLNLVLCFITLIGLYFAGCSLGLFLSRWCGSVSKAVVSVPIAILPQIIFSKFVLPENSLKGFSLKIEKLMFVKWGFEALNAVKTFEVELIKYLQSIGILLTLSLIFSVFTLFHLWFIED